MSKPAQIKKLFTDFGINELTLSNKKFVFRVRVINGVHHIAAEVRG